MPVVWKLWQLLRAQGPSGMRGWRLPAPKNRQADQRVLRLPHESKVRLPDRDGGDSGAAMRAYREHHRDIVTRRSVIRNENVNLELTGDFAGCRSGIEGNQNLTGDCDGNRQH